MNDSVQFTMFVSIRLFYFEITYHYGRHELRNRMDIVSY